MTVRDCGELLPDQDWNYCDNDTSKEKLPPFPEDWDQKTHNFSVLAFILGNK